MRVEQRALREKVPRWVQADQITAKLQELEFKLAHDSLGDRDRIKVEKDLQDLKAATPSARQLVALELKLKESEAQRAAISKRLNDCDEVLKDLKAKEEAERAILDEFKSKANEEMVDVPSLIVEKKACWDMIVAFRDKITEIRKEYDAKYQEYLKQDRAYRGWHQLQKRKE